MGNGIADVDTHSVKRSRLSAVSPFRASNFMRPAVFEEECEDAFMVEFL